MTSVGYAAELERARGEYEAKIRALQELLQREQEGHAVTREERDALQQQCDELMHFALFVIRQQEKRPPGEEPPDMAAIQDYLVNFMEKKAVRIVFLPSSGCRTRRSSTSSRSLANVYGTTVTRFPGSRRGRSS